MPKSDDARTQGAIDEVIKLVPGAKGQRIEQLLSDWATGRGKGAVGKSIKLGGAFHSKDERDARTQVRAVLLGAQCFGMLTPGSDGYKTFAKKITKESTAELAKRLTDYYDAHRRFELLTASPFGIQYAPSFNFASDQVRRNCEEAYPQVHKMLEAGHREVNQAIGGIGNSVKRYEAWFGSVADGRPEKVKGHFSSLLEALKTQKLVLYYRGPLPSDAGSIRDDYNGFAPALSAKGEDYCGMATRRSKRNLACPTGDDMHIKLGNGVVVRGTVQAANGKNTYAGTIVHEMTHIVCETRDVKFKEVGTGRLFTAKGKSDFTSGKMAGNVPRQDNDGAFTLSYGPDLCRYMAASWPDKAVMNADNYCYFCEEFL
ncbi:MAG: hypothetical protein ABI696_17505 [Rubrivivax sp.]